MSLYAEAVGKVSGSLCLQGNDTAIEQDGGGGGCGAGIGGGGEGWRVDGGLGSGESLITVDTICQNV